ncbi:FAD-dependent oxidoreductase [Methanothermococcus okinawensis]|uniref:FAD-dependent pyridine nucleotide-disulfide oxidoreductase n=1 Tax=Methanothermococcus okinawensis (strain DSM 14208 / JCM 11175 / IH1) TaxID=647113 RepID=F8AN52_METOI|nr:FAD-dependent oxidoreductase [Methanothermococcus okinawensis]AEH06966.1 FAD-dependent pyridine nucleotide-disulfide oxidoreductase [Methanothermococcus okinawensis IH1]
MKNMENVKIAVVGCGPAGKSCAIELAKKGFDVDIYEKNKVGGTCLNYGCTYINGLREMADIINNLNLIKNNNYDKNKKIVLEDIISFKELQRKISDIQNKIRLKLENSVTELPNINIYYKEFKDRYENNYDYVVYATGKTYTSEYNGIKCLGYYDIVNLEELPDKILIIGGGTVAAEYASLFSNFGSEVVVYVRSKFLKMIEDKDIREYIYKFIDFRITNNNSELTKLLNDEDYTKILAIGGKPKFETDDYMRIITNKNNNNGKNDKNKIDNDGNKSNNKNNNKNKNFNEKTNEIEKNIYACGDCVAGKGGITPIARMEGRVVAENIYNELNNKPLIKPKYELIPHTIRMDLNISYVGKQTNNYKIIPNSVGKGDFFRVSNHIGINKIYYENNRVVGAISMSPSMEIMPYFAQYLKGIDIYKDFVEIHPSTDPFYSIFRR